MDNKWLLNFLKVFRMCITNLRIYPINNASVTNAINTIEGNLNEFFKTNDALTFTELSGKLNIVGFENASPEIQPISEELARLFNKCRISSITIKKNHSLDELIFILQNLSKYFNGDWQALAEEKGYKNLRFNQVKYVAITEEETVVSKISALVSERGGDMAGIVALLKESFDIIDGVPPDEQSRMVTHLAMELAQQDAAVLREIFERELPPRVENSGIKEKLLAALTKDKISDVYQQIIKWYGEIKSSSASEFEAVEQLDKLKKFLKLILRSDSARDVPFKLYEELFNLGLIESIPDWAKKEAIPENLLEQVEIVLGMSDEKLITSLWAEKIPEIAGKLIEAQLKDKLAKLILKIVGNYKNEDYTVRQKTVEVLGKTINVLKSHGYENILAIIEHLLLEWFAAEDIRDVYESLSGILFDRLISRLLRSEFEPADRIFAQFKQLASEINLNEEKRKVVWNYLDKNTNRIVPIMLNDIKSSDEMKKKDAFEFLSKIGVEALDPLVKIIKEVDDLRLRLLSAGILKNLGEPAVQRISEELNLGLTKEEIRRFIEVLKFFGNSHFYSEVVGLLRYPDPEVKAEILRYLSGLDVPEVDTILIEYFDDPAIGKFAVKMAAQRKHREFAPALIHLISTTSDWELKEEIAIAMGEIGDIKFQEPLIALLKSGRKLFARMSIQQERARLRAAYVLRKFPKTSESIKALQKASKDKSQAIAITAAESLKILENG